MLSRKGTRRLAFALSALFAACGGASPSPAGDAAAPVDSRGRARDAQAGAGFVFNDVWRFDVMTETWAQVTAEGDAPPGRRTPWISVDADDRGFVMALGSAGVQPGETLDDLWRFDLVAGRWTQLTPDATPSARGWTGALPGAGSVRAYVFGSFDNGAPLGDLWRLRAERCPRSVLTGSHQRRSTDA